MRAKPVSGRPKGPDLPPVEVTSGHSPTLPWSLRGVVGLLFAALGVACSDFGSDPGPTSLPPPTSTPTWNGAIAALLAERCVSCHGSPPREGASDAFRLDVYDATESGGTPGAFETAARIRTRVVLQRSMPPVGALPATEIAAIDAWVRAGAPRDSL